MEGFPCHPRGVNCSTRKICLQVGISIPTIKATLSDREYRLITSVAGQNFGEELRLPEAALRLEEAYRPEVFEDAEAERTASEQVGGCLLLQG